MFISGKDGTDGALMSGKRCVLLTGYALLLKNAILPVYVPTSIPVPFTSNLPIPAADVVGIFTTYTSPNLANSIPPALAGSISLTTILFLSAS